RPVAQGRGAAPHATHPRDRRRPPVRARGRPRRAPRARRPARRGLRPGDRRGRRRPARGLPGRALRELVLRDQASHHGRGRRRRRSRRPHRAGARRARLRRALGPRPALQLQADGYAGGARPRPAHPARRLPGPPTRDRRALPWRPRRGRPMPRARRRGRGGARGGAGGVIDRFTLLRLVLPAVLLLSPVRDAFVAARLLWLYLALLAWGLAFFVTPLVRGVAHWRGVLDLPAERKVHRFATPLLGGVAVWAALAATVLANFEFSRGLKGVAVGGAIVVALGVLDDVFDVPARLKLAGQVAAAAAAIGYGVVLDAVPTWVPGVVWLNVLLTTLWFL